MLNEAFSILVGSLLSQWERITHVSAADVPVALLDMAEQLFRQDNIIFSVYPRENGPMGTKQ